MAGVPSLDLQQDRSALRAYLRFGRGVWLTAARTYGALASPQHTLNQNYFAEQTRRWARDLCALWGMRIETVGLDRIPSGPTIVVANHQSYADVVALLAVLPGKPRFVGKEELQRMPIVGRAMRAGGHIFIRRESGKHALAALSRAAEEIRSGGTVVVFPEGTRSRNGELGPFQGGACVLAKQARVPITPVAIVGTAQVNPAGTFAAYPAKVTLRFGASLSAATVGMLSRHRLAHTLRSAVAQLAVPPGPARAECPGGSVPA